MTLVYADYRDGVMEQIGGGDFFSKKIRGFVSRKIGGKIFLQKLGGSKIFE